MRVAEHRFKVSLSQADFCLLLMLAGYVLPATYICPAPPAVFGLGKR